MPLKFWKSTVRERVRDLELLMSSAEARIFALEDNSRPKLALKPSRKPKAASKTPRCVEVVANGDPCKSAQYRDGLCFVHTTKRDRLARQSQNGIAPSLVV